MTQKLPLPLTPEMLAPANPNAGKPRYTAAGVAEDWHGGQVGNEQDQAEPMQAIANSHSANTEDDYDPQHQEEKGEDMHQPMVPLSDLGIDYGFYGGQPYRDGDIGPRNPYPSAEVLDEPAGVAAFDTRRVPLPITSAMLARANENEPRPRYGTPADWSQGVGGNDIDTATLTTPVVTRASADAVTPWPINTQVEKGAAMAPPLTPLGDLGVDYGIHAGETGRTGNVAPGAPYDADSSAGGGGGDGASQWPDASDTGVPPGTTLTPHSGDYTTTGDGQVVSGLAVTNGTIQVNHANVTVQRCSITTTGTYGVFVATGKTGCIVQDCTITGAQTGIQGFGTFRRNDISGVENGVVIANGSGTTITDNYIHDLFALDPHYDGIACHGGCNNILIQNNWISGTPAAIIQGVFLTDEFGPANNIVINDNYVGECTYNLIANGALTAVTITNNLLKEGTTGFYNITAATPAGNISTRGYYIDGDMPPVEGTVVFTPSNLITAGADRNNDTGFRVGATLAQAIDAEFRIVLYAGDISAMGLDSVWFGKASSGQTATAALSPITFGGSAAALSLVQLSRFIVSDWMPKGALSFPAGSVMLIGFALRNPGGTGLAVTNSNANSYFGTLGNVAQASPGYTASSGTCYALARIETRAAP